MIPGIVSAQATTPGAPVLNINTIVASGPFFIGHRGAGAFMYPEFTSIAYAGAIADGLQCVEADCFSLSGTTRLGVMHDSTIDRVTTGTGNTQSQTEANWSSLVVDTNSWFGGGHGNQSALFFDDVLASYVGQAVFFAEAKYTTGGTSEPGGKIVTQLQAAGVPTTQAVVCAFELSQLSPAVSAGYPAAIVESPSGPESIASAQSAGVTWAVLDRALSDTRIGEWITAGFTTITYNINRHWQRIHYTSLGVHGFFSNDPTYAGATTPFATADNFSAQTWMPGMIHYDGGTEWTTATRGQFFAPDYWGFGASTDDRQFVLQGWACPIKSDAGADNFTIDLKITFDAAASTARWACVYIADETELDRAYDNNTGNSKGYAILFRKDGIIHIYRQDTTAASAVQIAAVTASTISTGTEVRFQVVVTPTTVAAHRLDGTGAITHTASVADATYRGGYFHLGRRGLACKFRDITIS